MPWTGVELPAGLYVSDESKAEAMSEDVKAVLAQEQPAKKKKSKKIIITKSKIIF